MITAASTPLTRTAAYSARKCSPSPTKSITTLAKATETTEKIVFYMILYTVPVSFAMALFVWQTPTWEHLAWLVVTALVANAGQFAMTNSYRAAEATAVFPFDFARLPFTALLAWIVFAEALDLWTWLGAAVIFVASAQQMRSESRRRPPETGK